MDVFLDDDLIDFSQKSSINFQALFAITRKYSEKLNESFWKIEFMPLNVPSMLVMKIRISSFHPSLQTF